MACTLDQPAAFAASHGRALWLAAAHAVLLALCLYPIVGVATPPLIDYPNHLARLHVLTAIDTDPALQAIYRVEWNLVSNLAMDTVVPLLAPVLGLEPAGKVFLAISLGLVVAGTVLLHRRFFGQVGWSSLLVYLFFFNLTVAFGFVNFLFGIGLALCLMALWDAGKDWKPHWQVPVFSVAATLLFAVHLTALLVYGLVVAVWVAERALQARRAGRPALKEAAVGLAQFVVPALLLASFAGGLGDDGAIRYDLGAKTRLISGPFLFLFDFWEAAFFVIASALLLRLHFSGALTLHRRLRYPLLALVATAVLLPNYAFVGWGHDIRLLLPIVCLMAAAAALDLRGRRAGIVLVALLVGLAGVRVGLLTDYSRQVARQSLELRQAIAGLPAGSALLPAFSRDLAQWPDLREDRSFMALKRFNHMASLGLLETPIFIPTLFTTPTVQPLAVRPRYADLDAREGDPPRMTELLLAADGLLPVSARAIPAGRSFLVDWPAHFDYLVMYDFGEPRNPLPDVLTPVRRGSFFTLFRIAGGGAEGGDG
jgi:hypothetical protein